MDNDGDLDAVIGNDRIENIVFKNDGSEKLQFDHTFGHPESNTRSLCLADLNKSLPMILIIIPMGVITRKKTTPITIGAIMLVLDVLFTDRTTTTQ